MTNNEPTKPKQMPSVCNHVTRRVRNAAKAKIINGDNASAIEAFAVLTRAQPMNTHHAITLVPIGPNTANKSQSCRVGITKSLRRFSDDRHSHTSITPPATTNRMSDNTSGDTPHERVNSAPTTNVDANATTLTAASKTPMSFILFGS